MKLVFGMERRGDVIYDTIVHTIIFVLFFSGTFWFVSSYTNGAAFWEDFYAKEIVALIDKAEPGMKFTIDVTPLAIVASRTGVPVRDVVSFDNVHNKVVVRTRLGSGTSFSFFNDLDVVYSPVVSPSGSSVSTQLVFEVKEKIYDVRA